MKGGSYDDVPNPKNTVVTTPGEGTMTEEAWMASENSKMIRNGYAGYNGGSRRRSRHRRNKKSRNTRKTLKHHHRRR